eukprot:512023-Prorocentrum_lima.AAC.1
MEQKDCCSQACLWAHSPVSWTCMFRLPIPLWKKRTGVCRTLECAHGGCCGSGSSFPYPCVAIGSILTKFRCRCR